MAAQVVATKGNLIKARKSLALAQNGFELMDRKRNILIREMMSQVEKVKVLLTLLKRKLGILGLDRLPVCLVLMIYLIGVNKRLLL